MSMSSPQIYLDGAINEILSAIKLSPTDSTRRYQVIKKLLPLLDSSSLLTGSSVEPYGSFASHLSPSWGDLEISINLPISSTSHIQALQHLENTLRLLHGKDGWHIKRGVSYAKEIPILRVDQGNISCDVSVNNWLGLVRSNIFLLISQMDDRFPHMVLLVKEWSRAKDICYSENKIINSYCLTLLVIFHFQTCEPAILPPFKDLYPGSVAQDLIHQGWNSDAVGRISEKCANNVAIWRSNKLKRPTNFSSLSELWVSFVEKFSNLDGIAQSYQICTFTGQLEDKYCAEDMSSQLIVKDPFDEKENVGSAVRSLSKLCEAFKSTYYTLT